MPGPKSLLRPTLECASSRHKLSEAFVGETTVRLKYRRFALADVARRFWRQLEQYIDIRIIAD